MEKTNSKLLKLVEFLQKLKIKIFKLKNYDYNYFVKGVKETGKTTFSRDSKIKCSKKRSYKIENKEFNDAI